MKGPQLQRTMLSWNWVLLNSTKLATLFASLAIVASYEGRCAAQTITTLATFNNTNGEEPESGLTLVGSTLFGTTLSGGGDYVGTVFSVPISGGNIKTLVTFSGDNYGTNGGTPQGGLTLSGSTLFGSASLGGANNDGTIFSISTSGGNFRSLASFSGSGSGGERPSGNLTLIGSNLYGTTTGGGTYGDGTVYSVPVAGGAATTLFSFNGSDGEEPVAGLTLYGSTLYGTTEIGGSAGKGTIFSMPLSGGSITTLCTFNGINGANPTASLTLSGSTLFGTSSGDGVHNEGTVFDISTSGGSLATLVSFNGSNGNSPYGAALTLSGSTLYGTTNLGGASGHGNIFSLNTSGTGFKDIFDFSGTEGTTPNSTLIVSGQIIYGATVSGGSTGLGTIFALNIAPATVTLSSSAGTAIIRDGSTTLGAAVSNSTSAGYNLNYTLGASVVSGSATLGTITSSTGSLAPGGTQSCTVSATSTNLGVNVIAFSASDPNSSNLSATSTAALTVLDHSNASLSSSITQLMQTINFGNILKGASLPSQSFTIYNLAANTSAAYTANMKLTGFTTSGDSALTTSLSTFSGLTATGGSNGKTFIASLNTGNYTTTGTGAISISAPQLVDDSTLSGAGHNNNGGLTIALQGNVGNATAEASNSQSTLGPALIAPVAANGSYANLASTVKSTTGSGGAGTVGTTATILGGTNSSGSAQTVSMQWRTRTQSETAGLGVVSDIVNVGGMALSGSSGQTAPFVLQMDYDPGFLPGTSAANDPLYLAWLDPATDDWVNAIDGDFGTNLGTYHLGAWQPGDLTLGDWGVNVANHTVWAVVNHNSEFAVVPEPSTLTLLGVATIGLLGFARRKSLGAKTKTSPASRPRR